MANLPNKKPKFQFNKEAIKTGFGLFLIAFSILIFIAFISFFFNWKADQSEITAILNQETSTNNLLGNFGAYLSDLFIHHGIGIAAFLIPISLFIFGVKVLIDKNLVKVWKYISHSIFILIWLPLLLGYFLEKEYVFSGVYGFEVADYLKNFFGDIGIIALLFLSLALYLIFEFNLTSKNIKENIDKKSEKISNIKNSISESITKFTSQEERLNEEKVELDIPKSNEFNSKEKIHSNIENKSIEEKEIKLSNPKNSSLTFEINTITDEGTTDEELLSNFQKKNDLEDFTVVVKKEDEAIKLKTEESSLQMSVKTTTEVAVKENEAGVNIEELPPYDPRLELSNYQFPNLDLMRQYDANESININSEELENNKNKIVETLGNYGIGISHIKATVGPTVTLYEIIPDAGIRISKIKNLEDDIALSLAALGIRIIAPIPGKGTIGIEVPNSKPSIVSMRSVLASPKFQKAEMELPIVFGKTISNETFVEDLAKMPHLLLAGATGQGKSVGLNAVITSLLYRKHPAELKFVLIDPKKVELTLYNKIERHFLAKLPDTEEAIITDNQKVIHTLNSLCIEMDDRYNLLKNAFVRNIKEYNEKFIKRQLNPEKGHRFLPYIVLIVDEFADLIMTAGKEVELPIARLAQLARAIGIHLIIATQRPSVNVITGTIKANFPARIAFRVTSKIDSRTILDGSGADQLIGRGDMLFTKGSDMVRLQCAFVDTPEVEKVTEFIGNQRAFPEAYLLPEFNPEEGGNLSFDSSDKDEFFEEAARLLVNAQQGSTSLIQRKLSLGYNRAGRIMDQLEAAGIVGPFEGSKARKVLYADLVSLEQYLEQIR
jgi:S-DNA-T family DNA segregation ATPase FtsK/SpoIIIE